MNREALRIQAINDSAEELNRAIRLHPPMRGPHEGYALILEELEELWEEIKRKTIDRDRMRREAVQVAAMAMRFVADVCCAPETPEASKQPQKG